MGFWARSDQNPDGDRPSIVAMPTVVVGGNAVDVHLKGVVPGRDFPLERVDDVRNADAGDPCPRCGAPLQITSGLEIGTSSSWDQVLQGDGGDLPGREGERVHAIMGCYGIGINRIVAGAVEAAHDSNGILWPLAWPLTTWRSFHCKLKAQR